MRKMKKLWIALWRWLYDPEVNELLARKDNELEGRGL